MLKNYIVLVITCLALSACSIPRIVVLSDPLTAKEHNDLGVSYELMGETELALKEYELAFKQDRKWDQPLINHGNVHAGLENWDEAQSSYQEALKRNSQNPEAMNNLAYVLLKQDQSDDALVWSGRAVEIQPDNPYFLNTHATAYFKAGNPVMAKQYLVKALEHTSEDSPLRERILHELEKLP
ncbi:MAG: tetratricopeptide repeat protein [Desulfonatronovibrio sp. MSAO_Bac4]|nr:MAG: tetratricopeptide repeat protein [Desulfonatronovibrio sp. MSAO_Bac4]